MHKDEKMIKQFPEKEDNRIKQFEFPNEQRASKKDSKINEEEDKQNVEKIKQELQI